MRGDVEVGFMATPLGERWIEAPEEIPHAGDARYGVSTSARSRSRETEPQPMTAA